jgi:hypothetical protein
MFGGNLKKPLAGAADKPVWARVGASQHGLFTRSGYFCNVIWAQKLTIFGSGVGKLFYNNFSFSPQHYTLTPKPLFPYPTQLYKNFHIQTIGDTNTISCCYSLQRQQHLQYRQYSNIFFEKYSIFKSFLTEYSNKKCFTE